ncbi:hypothetical protein [Nonomuraea bangladeshensis]|uniref:hypothetical protein n=1 Tax=Nonomuraea bangladeshensis TaxID=404385 RepID=UPI003C2FA237
MTWVEIVQTLALVSVAITLLMRARRRGRNAQDYRQLRTGIILMFACWFGAMLLVRITAWTA